MTSSPSTSKIDDTAWISLALFRTVLAGFVMLAMSLFGAVWWASSVTTKLEAAVETSKAAVAVQAELGIDIAAIRVSMSGLALTVHDVQRDLQDQWKRPDMAAWTAELQRLNPSIIMPALARDSLSRDSK